jgi:hypothetical protein
MEDENVGRLPPYHPLVAESTKRLSLMDDERTLRQCLCAILEQRVSGMRYRPAEPQELGPLPDSFGLQNSLGSASGSFYNTPSTSNLATPNVRRESVSDAATKLLDTGDIEVYLKQMQRKHHEEYRRQHAYVKVHYHRSKASAIQTYIDRNNREEDEVRGDIEVVEQLMRAQLMDVFRVHRYSKLMGLQVDEALCRTRLLVSEVEEMHDVLVKLRAATESWEIQMVSHAASSPQRVRSAAPPTPLRPPSGLQSSGRLCRGRSASIAMDGSWVESFLGGNETRARMELENERDGFMERMELCSATERHAIAKAYVFRSSKVEGALMLVGGVPENESRRYVRAMCSFLSDEENLLRHHLEVLYDQGAKRLRMLCQSAVCDVDLSRAGSFRLKSSFTRGSPILVREQ